MSREFPFAPPAPPVMPPTPQVEVEKEPISCKALADLKLPRLENMRMRDPDEIVEDYSRWIADTYASVAMDYLKESSTKEEWRRRFERATEELVMKMFGSNYGLDARADLHRRLLYAVAQAAQFPDSDESNQESYC